MIFKPDSPELEAEAKRNRGMAEDSEKDAEESRATVVSVEPELSGAADEKASLSTGASGSVPHVGHLKP